LDKQKKKIKHISESSVRNEIKKWLGNRKYIRQKLLSVIRDRSWRQKEQYALPKKKSFHTQNYRKKTLISTIPSNITSLLQPNILIEGHKIGDFLSSSISVCYDPMCTQP
jgi:hypothetical protein